MNSWIALLRAVNVGGNNRVPMAELRQVAMHSGAERPRTYLQSGNLVFNAPADAAEEIVEKLRKGMVHSIKVDVPVILRSGEQLLEAIRESPFHEEASDPKSVAIGFLSAEPDPAKVAALDPERSPGDRFAVMGTEIHVHYTNGVANSKLTNAWFEKELGLDCTFRNWRTVEQLIKMADPPRTAAARGVGLRGLSYVMVHVTEMDRSVAFYRDSLGLKCILESPYWSEFHAGGTKIALHGGAKGKAPKKTTGGTATLGFNVADLDATHAAMVANKVPFSQEPTDRPEEGIRLAVATDPDGLAINITQTIDRA